MARKSRKQIAVEEPVIESVSSEVFSTAIYARHPENTAAVVERYLVTGDGGPSSGANYSKLIWSFFVFQQWYQAYRSF